MDEQIVLLDSAHKPIGTASKLASHHADTPLHLAFSCYLFNAEGEVLITKRASTKKVWPGVWTNSFCGHPMPGESIEKAVRRRANYELGVSGLDQLQEIIADYQYRTPPYHGIIENEFCPIYAARLAAPLLPNPDEVSDYRWLAWDDIDNLIAGSPDSYSYWFKDQLPLLSSNSRLQQVFL